MADKTAIYRYAALQHSKQQEANRSYEADMRLAEERKKTELAEKKVRVQEAIAAQKAEHEKEKMIASHLAEEKKAELALETEKYKSNTSYQIENLKVTSAERINQENLAYEAAFKRADIESKLALQQMEHQQNQLLREGDRQHDLSLESIRGALQTKMQQQQIASDERMTVAGHQSAERIAKEGHQSAERINLANIQRDLAVQANKHQHEVHMEAEKRVTYHDKVLADTAAKIKTIAAETQAYGLKVEYDTAAYITRAEVDTRAAIIKEREQTNNTIRLKKEDLFCEKVMSHIRVREHQKLEDVNRETATHHANLDKQKMTHQTICHIVEKYAAMLIDVEQVKRTQAFSTLSQEEVEEMVARMKEEADEY